MKKVVIKRCHELGFYPWESYKKEDKPLSLLPAIVAGNSSAVPTGVPIGAVCCEQNPSRTSCTQFGPKAMKTTERILPSVGAWIPEGNVWMLLCFIFAKELRRCNLCINQSFLLPSFSLYLIVMKRIKVCSCPRRPANPIWGVPKTLLTVTE